MRMNPILRTPIFRTFGRVAFVALAACQSKTSATAEPPASPASGAVSPEVSPAVSPVVAPTVPSAAATLAATTPPDSGPAKIGQPAPGFRLKDLDGKDVELASFRGKVVVLEWFNPDCPFVKLNHTKGPLRDMAKKKVEQGVVWLSINSGAPGKQGHGVARNRDARRTYAMTNPILLDETGDVGRAYGAKTTPHVFVVDGQGTLVYAGAIDNAQDGEPPGGDAFTNYVENALADVAAGRPVRTPQVPSYGCSVKYAH